jgi:WD40 repeat protein/serine/threonine protein kinase
MKHCLDPEQFQGLITEEVTATERAALEAHIDVCPICQEKLARLLDQGEETTASIDLERPRQPGSEVTPGSMQDFFRGLKERPPPSTLTNSPAKGDPAPEEIIFPDPPTALGRLGRIESYHIMEERGRGAFGVVFQAYDEKLRCRVAVKVLKPELAFRSRDRARFEGEARKAAAVRHDHVVTIHHVGDSPAFALPYFVMEFIEGESLSERLRRQGSLAACEAAEIARQVALGLAAAHARGLIHRDINAANVLLEQSTGRVKISDFGLARTLEVAEKLTQSGGIVGTPPYMSPEQILTPEQVDPRSDVYSLGVLLYEMLTGELPFRGVPRLVLYQVIHEEPRPPRRLNDKIPRDLETICLKAMAKEPARRYPSARLLAEELGRFLSGEPIQARPVRTWERTIKWAKRRPAVAVLVMVCCMAVLSLISLMGAWWRDAEARAVAVQELGAAKSLLRDLEQDAGAKRLELQSLAKSIEQGREQVRLAQLARRQALCIRDLQLADMALEKEQIDRVTMLLDIHRPSRQESNQEDIRGWEWHYLWRLCHQQRIRLRGHQGWVGFVRFTSDGKRLITRDVEGNCKVWDMPTGTQLAPPLCLQGKIHALTFTSDGRILATADEGGAVRLWDWGTGQLKKILKEGHNESVYALAFSPDSKLLAIGGDQIVQIWEVARGQERSVLRGHRSGVYHLSFSSDGSKLMTISHDDPIAKLWDVATGREQRAFSGKAGAYVAGSAFSPDGKILATAEAHPFSRELIGSVRLWDTATGKERSSFQVPDGGVFSVVFSPDGKTLASGNSVSGTIKLWDVATGRTRHTFYASTGRVYCLAFSPDGRTLSSASYDGTVGIWDLAARPSPAVLRGHTGTINSVSFSPDGKLLASRSLDQTIKLWDPVTGQERGTLPVSCGSVQALTFSPDSKMLATGNLDSTVRLWDVVTRKELAILKGHMKEVASLAFSPDGRTLASGGFDGTVRLWDLGTRKTRAIFQHPHVQVWGVAFAPDGKTLASSGGTAVILWDPATGQKRGGLAGSTLVSVCFSPDSKLVATGSWQGAAIRLWEASTGKELVQFRGHTGAVCHVVFTRDGKTVVSGSVDATVKFWDVATRQDRFTLKGHEAKVTALAFSPDGTMLATGSEDKTVRLWDALSSDDSEGQSNGGM